MEDKLFKTALAIALGGITIKGVNLYKYYRLQKEEHDEVVEDSKLD